MLKSMTGFGSALTETPDLIVRVEIKSLNSKFIDLNLRIPRQFSDKEIAVRTLISNKLLRGKINMAIDVEYLNAGLLRKNINKPLLIAYINEAKEVAEATGTSADNVLSTLLSMNDIMQLPVESTDEEQWKLIDTTIQKALVDFEEFRTKEGSITEKEIRHYLSNIQKGLDAVSSMKDEKIETVKDNIRNKLSELIDEEKIDRNRLEQELIYYSERLDISEELVRLQSHIHMFTQALEEEYPGKKAGFISQEVGREINTIGSKANDAVIQKQVIMMKEELEKIKEQILNIL